MGSVLINIRNVCAMFVAVVIAFMMSGMGFAETYQKNTNEQIIDSASGQLKQARLSIEQRDLQDWTSWKQNLMLKEKKFQITKQKGAVSLSGSQPVADLTKRNNFTGLTVKHGAILLGYGRSEDMNLCMWSLSGYCHAGLFNRNLYVNENSAAIRTANTNGGMLLESPRYWRQFEEVREMQVLGVTDAVRNLVVKRAMSYTGKYLITSKVDYSSWYCSKVIYRAYLDVTGIDLDADQGLIVFPTDIRWSIWTYTTRVYTS